MEGNPNSTVTGVYSSRADQSYTINCSFHMAAYWIHHLRIMSTKTSRFHAIIALLTTCKLGKPTEWTM
jgi:hypothetical protein